MKTDNPVVQALGERHLFYRTRLTFDKNGRKIMPEWKPFTTAWEAIKQPYPQAWDEPGTYYPLVITRSLLVMDFDRCFKNGKPLPAVEEAKERFRTYWDKSRSGNGMHALAFTGLAYINGHKKLAFQIGDTPDEKVEIFLKCQPAIITNQHEVLRPLANCDADLQVLVAEWQRLYPNITNTTIGGVVGYNTPKITGEAFVSWLRRMSLKRDKLNLTNKLSLTKRLLLQHIYDAPEYPYDYGWKPFYGEDVAQQLKTSPKNISEHLCELCRDKWLYRKYGKYHSGMKRVSVKLNWYEDAGYEEQSD
jgi:hypothetical protein